MNHIVGSAIKISAEIPSDQVTGTTLTLEKLIDPDGNDWASSQSLLFGVGESDTNIGSYDWQSVEGTHPAGRYAFMVKAVNGSIESFATGNFYLEEQP